MRAWVTAILMSMLLSANTTFASENVRAAESITEELARKSGMSVAQIDHLLTDCAGAQISLNVCAWRDQIFAERSLWKTIERLRARHPSRRTMITARIKAWQASSRRDCDRSAREYQGGSLEPMAKHTCLTANAQDFERRLRRSELRGGT